jgi:hypothetical protein
MKDLSINLAPELRGVVSERDVLNMLRALDQKIYASELYVDSQYLKKLMAQAIAAEANRNRYVQAWNIAFKKL